MKHNFTAAAYLRRSFFCSDISFLVAGIEDFRNYKSYISHTLNPHYGLTLLLTISFVAGSISTAISSLRSATKATYQ